MKNQQMKERANYVAVYDIRDHSMNAMPECELTKEMIEVTTDDAPFAFYVSIKQVNQVMLTLARMYVDINMLNCEFNFNADYLNELFPRSYQEYRKEFLKHAKEDSDDEFCSYMLAEAFHVFAVSGKSEKEKKDLLYSYVMHEFFRDLDESEQFKYADLKVPKDDIGKVMRFFCLMRLTSSN